LGQSPAEAAISTGSRSSVDSKTTTHATIYEFGKLLKATRSSYGIVDGDDLADLMRKETLTIPRSLQIIKEVAEAPEQAHQYGIIHCDIKPSATHSHLLYQLVTYRASF
jgi:hypothetical protein